MRNVVSLNLFSMDSPRRGSQQTCTGHMSGAQTSNFPSIQPPLNYPPTHPSIHPISKHFRNGRQVPCPTLGVRASKVDRVLVCMEVTFQGDVQKATKFTWRMQNHSCGAHAEGERGAKETPSAGPGGEHSAASLRSLPPSSHGVLPGWLCVPVSL